MFFREFCVAALVVGLIGCAPQQPESMSRDATKKDLKNYPRFDVAWTTEQEFHTELKLVRQIDDDSLVPVVGLTIDGVLEYFLVDTGAQLSAVSREFLSRHAHRETEFQTVMESFRHEYTVDVFALGTVDLGFAVIREMPVTLSMETDLGAINSQLAMSGHPKLVGSLGLDFLTVFGAVLDLRAQKIAFKKPGSASGSESR